MIPLSLAEIAAIVDGSVEGDPATVVTGEAFLDSRDPVPGGLFIAIAGEHADGHAFAEQAHTGGAAAMLGSRPCGVPAVLVADPVVALGRLARHVVDTLHPTVLALTGSQGKTGTKDYLAQVLARVAPTVATAGNLNNELGVPLTVLRAGPETTYLVVEMGARGIGHIGYLCDIAPPTVAAVLNVGTAHVGEFGSREAIAVAKGEIVEALPAGGTAVLNADDDLTAVMAGRTSAALLSFGLTGAVTWRNVTLDDLGRASFELGHDEVWHPVRLSQSGAHQVVNAAAAAAMALAAGVPLDEVAQGLTAAEATSRMRTEISERADGLLVINDAYNANPASMSAALDTLVATGGRRSRRTVAVLGEMRELGDGAREAHLEVGRFVAEAGVDVVVAVGDAARGIAEGARSLPEWSGEAHVTAGRDEAERWVRENVASSDVVLVKASRGVALEKLVMSLLEHEPPQASVAEVDDREMRR